MGRPGELYQSTLPRQTRYALQPTLQRLIADFLQSSLSRQSERPRLRIIQDPISKLNPEMLYRQIQYLVEEGDWMSKGGELIAWGGEG